VSDRVRDWLVFSDVHILVVAAGWMLGNSAVFDAALPPSFLALACVGAFLVYRVDRLLVASPEDLLNAPDRVDFSQRYRWALLAVALVLTLLAALLAVTMQVLWLEVACVIGALGVIYPLRILPGGRRPKDVAWLKTGLIAACWIGGGVVLPMMLFGSGTSKEIVVAAALYRTLWILPNLLAADWLDREGDQKAASGNLVVNWSARRLRTVLFLLPVMAGGFAMGLVWAGVPIAIMAIDLTGFLLLVRAAWRTIQQTGLDGGGMAGATASRMVLLDLWVAWPVLAWILVLAMG